jgi:hypothetical protein
MTLLMGGLFTNESLLGQSSTNQMPQDYWVDQGVSVPISQETANSYTLPPVADQANNIYWATTLNSWTYRTGLVTDGSQQTIWGYQSQIDLMDYELNVTKQFGSFWNAQGMTCDASNHLYVLDSDGRVYVYNSKQELVTTFLTGCQNGPRIPVATVYSLGTNWSIGSITNASGYNSSPVSWNNSSSSAISINAKSELFICDFASASVKVFTTNGTLLRSWGGVGIGMANFTTAPWGVQVNPDQTVSVIDNTSPANGTWQSGATIIKNFDAQGNYLGQSPYDQQPMKMSIAPDGFRASSQNLFYSNENIEGEGGGYINTYAIQGNFLPNGDVILVQGKNITKYNPWSAFNYYFIKYLSRNYYGKDLALSNMPPPLPVLLGTSQRAGTTYLDIDYKVIAATNTPVKVGMLAFVNGGTNLDSVIIPKTFVGESGTNIGANIPPNTTKSVTWDMGKDWSTNVGTVKIEILANDSRPLQPQWMETDDPANHFKFGGIVTDAWSMWLWLLATRDSRVTLVNGTVQGNAGTYYGQTLYGITGTNNNNWGQTNKGYYTNIVYDYGGGYSYTNQQWVSTNYIYGTTTNGGKFLQEIVDSQVPVVR